MADPLLYHTHDFFFFAKLCNLYIFYKRKSNYLVVQARIQYVQRCVQLNLKVKKGVALLDTNKRYVTLAMIKQKAHSSDPRDRPIAAR